MNINYDKLRKKFWYEDENGNEVENCEDHPGPLYYHSCFPLELTETIDAYHYHPTNPIIKVLCKRSSKFYRWISKDKPKTYKRLFTATTSISRSYGADCIVAMVNSGDFTLEEAIWVYGKSCERCMNVLLYKYLDGKEGYEEYSDEWKRAHTECDFCRGEDDNESEN